MEEQKNEVPEPVFAAKVLPPPKETEFYDLLEIPTDATTGQIKKAYFMKARKCHPDKHPDDPEAEELFKQISVAYECLSDPEKREMYHIHGKNGIEFGEIDPRAMFSMLFGGGKFDNYIGEISLFNTNPEDESPEAYEAANKERVEKLKNQLIEKLRPWMEGNAKGFTESILAEAAELKNESYGAELLQHIGYIYENEARQHLKGFLGISGLAAEVKEKAHLLKEVLSTLSQAAKTMMLEEELQLAQTEEERRLLEPIMQKESIFSMWKVARLDIESAIREACEEVMRDTSVDKPSRRRRAEGIKLIGKIWRKIYPEEGKEGAWQFLSELETQTQAAYEQEDANKWRNAFIPSKQKMIGN